MTTGRINQVAFLHDVAAPHACRHRTTWEQRGERASFVRARDKGNTFKGLPNHIMPPNALIRETDRRQAARHDARRRQGRTRAPAVGLVVHPRAGDNRKGLTGHDASIALGNDARTDRLRPLQRRTSFEAHR